MTRREQRRPPAGCSGPSGETASGSSCSGPTGAATAAATAGSPGSPSGWGFPPSPPATSTRTAKRRAHLQDAFVAIRLGMTLEESESLRRGNSSSALASPRKMAARFAEHPDAVTETLRVAERLEFDLSRELGYRYPREEEPGVDRKLAELCRALLAERYADSPHRRRGRRRAGERAEDDPRPRPLRLLPPPPRPARARPRSRRRGAGPGLGPLDPAARPRPRLQRQLDRLLPHRPLPHRPGRQRPQLQPLPQRGGRQAGRRRRCPTSTSTSRATSARC